MSRFLIRLFVIAFFLALPLGQLSAEVIDPKIAAAEFVAMGLKPVVTKHVDPRFAKLDHPEDQYYLSIQFGTLTRAQFDQLNAHFGNVSQVPYHATRKYELLDFVHPAIQAVANKTYRPVYHSAGKDLIAGAEEPDPDLWAAQKNGIGDFTNCWNTTTEILCNVHAGRDPKNPEYYLYWPGRWEADEWFSSSDHSDVVKQEDLRTGDVLTIKERMSETAAMLQHTAYLLTPQLVFEKTDGGADDPYRISLRKDVVRKYARHFGPELVVEYRRFGGAGKTPIPTPMIPSDRFAKDTKKVLQEAFPKVNFECVLFGCETSLGGGCDPTLVEVHVTQIAINAKTGRGMLVGDRSVLKRFRRLVR